MREIKSKLWIWHAAIEFFETKFTHEDSHGILFDRCYAFDKKFFSETEYTWNELKPHIICELDKDGKVLEWWKDGKPIKACSICIQFKQELVITGINCSPETWEGCKNNSLYRPKQLSDMYPEVEKEKRDGCEGCRFMSDIGRGCQVRKFDNSQPYCGASSKYHKYQPIPKEPEKSCESCRWLPTEHGISCYEIRKKANQDDGQCLPQMGKYLHWQPKEQPEKDFTKHDDELEYTGEQPEPTCKDCEHCEEPREGEHSYEDAVMYCNSPTGTGDNHDTFEFVMCDSFTPKPTDVVQWVGFNEDGVTTSYDDLDIKYPIEDYLIIGFYGISEKQELWMNIDNIPPEIILEERDAKGRLIKDYRKKDRASCVACRYRLTCEDVPRKKVTRYCDCDKYEKAEQQPPEIKFPKGLVDNQKLVADSQFNKLKKELDKKILDAFAVPSLYVSQAPNFKCINIPITKEDTMSEKTSTRKLTKLEILQDEQNFIIGNEEELCHINKITADKDSDNYNIVVQVYRDFEVTTGTGKDKETEQKEVEANIELQNLDSAQYRAIETAIQKAIDEQLDKNLKARKKYDEPRGK
jgi:hypothetical protein